MTVETPTHQATQALEAERYVLAAMMLDAGAAQQAAGILTARDFSIAPHQHVFEAIGAITERSESCTAVILMHELQARGRLELVGGPGFIAALLQYATTTANLEPHCRIVLEAAARRGAMRLAASIHEGASDSGVNLSGLLASIGRQAAEVSSRIELKRPPTLDEQMETVEEALERGEPPVQSIVGSGLMIEGGITLVASLPKFGKTFLALQVQRAMAEGSEWLGHGVQEGASLMVQLEMPKAGILDRLRAEAQRLRGRLILLAKPRGWASITDPRTLDELCSSIERRGIRLAVLDPYRAIHQAPENDNDEQGKVMDALRLACDRTGVSIVILHHVNKFQMDKSTDLRSAVLYAVRGSGRLVSDSDTILGMVRLHGQTRLVFAGARFGSFPESIAIRQDECGWFSVIDTPEEKRDENEAAVEKFLLACGSSGMTVRELCAATGRSERVLRRALTVLNVPSRREPGRNGRTHFYWPGCEPEENETLTEGGGW